MLTVTPQLSVVLSPVSSCTGLAVIESVFFSDGLYGLLVWVFSQPWINHLGSENKLDMES
jgi:hypothetical protein